MKPFNSTILFCFLLPLLGFCENAKLNNNTIGKFPLCEPSAAVSIQCPNGNKSCLLIGDNEVKNKLFYFPVESGKLQQNKQNILSMEDFKIQDIEAIAKIDNSRLLIFGSHSRNKTCKIKKKRLRFAQIRISGNRLELVGGLIQTKRISANLFDSITNKDDKLVIAVKNAIEDSELAANKAKGNENECEKASAFNIEGAVLIGDDVWIGLRSPLVDWKQKKYAVLLRLKDLESLNFDAISLLDLGGRGIRELNSEKDSIFGIAGGPEDGKDNFVLWKAPISSIKANAVLKPNIITDLPKSSEGLAFINSVPIVVIDGDKGDSDCKKPGKFIQVEN